MPPNELAGQHRRDPRIRVPRLRHRDGGAALPGDRVARYSSSGWIDLVFLGSRESRWQAVSAEDHPNLVWLPTATLIAVTALLIALQRRVATKTSAALE
jgi:hypothetical protein